MYNPCDTCTEQKCNCCLMQVKKLKKPTNDELLVVPIDLDEMDFGEWGKVVEAIRKAFPDTNVIGTFSDNIYIENKYALLEHLRALEELTNN